MYGQLIFDKAGKHIQWNKDSLFSKWSWENWTATCRRINLDHILNIIHKTKLTMDERPKCRAGSHQNPWGESRQKPLLSWLRNFLLNTSPEGRETKAKMNYWDLIKVKTFCTVKETISKTKRQPMEWDRIFANDISDEGLVSKICKELIKINTQKQTIQWRDFPKKTSRWLTNIRKYAQHHSSSGGISKIPPRTCQNG